MFNKRLREKVKKLEEQLNLNEAFVQKAIQRQVKTLELMAELSQEVVKIKEEVESLRKVQGELIIASIEALKPRG